MIQLDIGNGAVPRPAGNVNAYVSRPKDGKNLGTVIVIHENRGLSGTLKMLRAAFRQGWFRGDRCGLHGPHRRQ